MTERIGIAAAGNWIVDRVKILDRLPGRGMLGNILSMTQSPGGAPANVLADLARMCSQLPLSGVGVTGDDDDGRYLHETFQSLGVNVEQLIALPDAPTSFTDVMTEEATGVRSFFHHRGANAMFGPEHVNIDKLDCRIFHLGYLLLLDRMDAADEETGTVAARLLRDVRAAGIKTSVDVVSEDSDRFRTIVPPALKHVDYLMLNEVEAGRIVGIDVRDSNEKLDAGALREAVAKLAELGSMEWIFVHMPEGAYIKCNDGRTYSCGSQDVPDGFIVSSVGAGDACCAGMLFGVHQNWDIEQAARFSMCCATAALSAGGASDGLRPIEALLDLEHEFEFSAPPVG